MKTVVKSMTILSQTKQEDNTMIDLLDLAPRGRWQADGLLMNTT